MPKPGFTAGDAKQENDPGGQNGTTLAMDTSPIWSLGDPPKWARAATQEPLRAERGNKLCCDYIFQFRHGGGGEGGFYSGGY